MSENHLNKHFRTILSTHAAMQRVEPALANVGFPDWYITFPHCKILVEAKHIKEWPKRSRTGIKFKRFEPHQRAFIYKHGKFGNGGVFILVQVEDDILLFSHDYVYELEGSTKKQCFDNCIFHWSRSARLWRSKQFKEKLVEILFTN